MPTNLELKVRVPDLSEIERRIRTLQVASPTVLRQTDTYLRVPRGRLKFRLIEGKQGELIQYDRQEEGGDRVCRYRVYPADERLLDLLRESLEPMAVVRKTRTVYFYRHTRIHLDEVEGLGAFVEPEVQEAENLSQARGEHDEIVGRLGLDSAEQISCSYLDLRLRMLSG